MKTILTGIIIVLTAAVTSTSTLAQSDSPLLEAARSGDALRVRQILAHGADINGTDAKGRTALMIAVLHQRKPVVDSLLAEGADVNVTLPSTGDSALLMAAANEDGDILKGLIKHGARVDVADIWGHTPSINAAIYGKPENLKILEGVGAVFRNDLVYSSALGQLEIIQQLLQAKANINATNEIGWTPLAAAAANNQIETAKLLLERGADANSQGMSGDFRETALLLASSEGHTDIVKLLLSKKSDPNASGFDTKAHQPTGATALTKAVDADHEDIVKALLEAGADPNEHSSGTPVLCLAVPRYPALAKLLLDKGADINAQVERGSNKGATALLAATFFGNAESVRLLLSRGARVSTKTEQGTTALQLAEALLEEESSPDKRQVREQIVQMISNPDSLPDLDALKKLGDAKTTKLGTPIDSTTITKAVWKKTYYARFPAGSIVAVTKFKSVFGNPSRSQTTENDTYWYYLCSDGTIQVVLNNPDVLGDAAAIKAVNDF